MRPRPVARLLEPYCMFNSGNIMLAIMKMGLLLSQLLLSDCLDSIDQLCVDRMLLWCRHQSFSVFIIIAATSSQQTNWTANRHQPSSTTQQYQRWFKFKSDFNAMKRRRRSIISSAASNAWCRHTERSMAQFRQSCCLKSRNWYKHRYDGVLLDELWILSCRFSSKLSGCTCLLLRRPPATNTSTYTASHS